MRTTSAVSCVPYSVCTTFVHISVTSYDRQSVSHNRPPDCFFNSSLRLATKKPSRSALRWPVNSPHKGPLTGRMFPFDNVIMLNECHVDSNLITCRSDHKGFTKCIKWLISAHHLPVAWWETGRGCNYTSASDLLPSKISITEVSWWGHLLSECLTCGM